MCSPVCCSAGARHAEAGCAGQKLQCLTCFWGSMPIHLPQGVEHRGTMHELAVGVEHRGTMHELAVAM